jgi:hypothetical protein
VPWGSFSVELRSFATKAGDLFTARSGGFNASLDFG